MSSSEEDKSNAEYSAPSESEEDTEARIKIREDLKSMSFEELMKLKEKLGAKVYKEAILGEAQSRSKKKPSDFKRLNKNRPREQSSRKQVPFLRGVNNTTKSTATEVRDPRFDKNSGTYDPNKFKDNYMFLNDIRKQEISDLQKKLSKTTDKVERENIRFVMQRLKNKNIEDERWRMKQDVLKEEQLEIQKAKNEGRNPHYATKKERRAKELVKKFVQLKSTGSLAKHLEKKRKKNVAKDRKKFSFD